MDLGAFVKEERISKGFSARELARRSGVSQPYLSQLENGKTTNPSVEVLNKLAKGLGVDYFDLMHKAGYFNAEEAKYRKEIKEETERDLQELSRFLDKNQMEIEEIQKEDASFIIDKARYYNGCIITENDRQLIKNFLEALFSGRNKEGN